MAEPIVPRSLVNPVGQTDRINRTVSHVVAALDVAELWLLSRLKDIPVKEFQINRSRYEYQIDVFQLEQIVREIAIQLGMVPDDYVVQEVIKAYEHGTDQAVTNLSGLTDDYTRNITQVLLSEPYQRRVALAGARVFEEMQGFHGETGRRLARVLRHAVQDGRPPLQVADDIEKEFGIARSRAETIARTEITGALRRGRLDEGDDAEERLGIKTGVLWVSALKPTTRLWHAQRHGLVYTRQEVREFYAVDGNAINCYCGITEILLGADGKPVSQKSILRLKKQKDVYFGRTEAT
jgi:hypothetical protein